MALALGLRGYELYGGAAVYLKSPLKRSLGFL